MLQRRSGRASEGARQAREFRVAQCGFDITNSARFAVIAIVTFFWGIQASSAGSIEFNSGDTVTVTAERAWETDEVDVIHFSGQFELRAPDWYLSGDSATVYGNLDNPESGGPGQTGKNRLPARGR